MSKPTLGKLRNTLEFQRQEQTTDLYDNVVITWVHHFKAYGQIQPIGSGYQHRYDDRLSPQNTHTITIRPHVLFDESDRIIANGTQYVIHNVNEYTIGRIEYLVLGVEQVDVEQ